MTRNRKQTNSQNSLFDTPTEAVGFIQNNSLSQMCYSVKKRILVPSWWVRGYLIYNQATDIYKIMQRDGKVPKFLPPNLPPKHFSLISSLWTEFIRKVVSKEGFNKYIEIDLHKYLRGNSIELTEQLSLIESYWATPIRVLKETDTVSEKTRKRKNVVESEATLNFVKQSRIEKRNGGTYLIIDLNVTIGDFCFGRYDSKLYTKPECEPHDAFVSLNPDVLRAFGTGKSPKNLCLYLLIEYGKKFSNILSHEDSAWNGGFIEFKELIKYHKELLSKTNSLYDHGIFGWKNEAPSMSIADLRAGYLDKFGLGRHKAAIHLTYLSEQALRARQTESLLAIECGMEFASEKIFPKNTAEMKRPQLAVCQNNPEKDEIFATEKGILREEYPVKEETPAWEECPVKVEGLEKSASLVKPEIPVKPENSSKEDRSVEEECSFKFKFEEKKNEVSAPKSHIINKPSTPETSPSFFVPRPPVTPISTAPNAPVKISPACPIFPTAPHEAAPVVPAIPSISTEPIVPPKPLTRGPGRPAKQTKSATDFEKEYMVKMVNYYESLSEEERVEFDKQRTKMTPEQFKDYLAPILQIRRPPKRI